MKPKSHPFDAHHERYEAWFRHHDAAYHSELLAVRALLPRQGLGLEIGVGTGRFAAPLGVTVGVDPSMEMLGYAVKRGILAVQAIGEALPFKTAVFDFVLAVTTICFVTDAKRMLVEACRVLKPGALVVIGFVDRDSKLGRIYLDHQAENVFYREATFYSGSEVNNLLKDVGFDHLTWVQTLSTPLDQLQEIEALREGYGSGGFVVVSASR
jgi:SAM-dependent methyltransferase